MSVWVDVVGQPDAVEALTEAVREPESMTHAWLFTGPPGSGRSVAARAFAAALQCDNGGCGHCQACHTALTGTHAYVTVVVPEGLSFGVAEARELVRTGSRKPSGGRWQIVIIEDADRLTERAANALLKAVEEPPPRGVFLLCAPSLHPDDVPITIRSRCRAVSLTTPSADAIAEVLIRRDGIEPDMAAWAAGAAHGHVGRARHLARDDNARMTRQAVLDIPASLTSLAACLAAADQLILSAEEESRSRSAVLDTAETENWQLAYGAGGQGPGLGRGAARGAAGAMKELERRQKSRATRLNRDSLDRSLVDLAGCYRDVLVVRARSADAHLAHPDRRADTAALAASMGASDALIRLEAVLACREALELNVKPRVALEAMTSRLRLPRSS
ncbi:DNA polymerase III subunit delta' [soil metagenome]